MSKRPSSSVFANNFRASMREHYNTQRTYTLNNDGASLMLLAQR